MDCFILPCRENSGKNHCDLGRAGRSRKKRSSKIGLTLSSAKLNLLIESPPLVCYGPPANSTGALLSGRLRIVVTKSDGEVTLNKFALFFTMTTTTKKPVSSHCPDCATRTEELSRWNFLTESPLKSGSHDFPFGYLFPGYLPASCSSSLGEVEYFLQARAESTTGEEYNLKVPLHVSRALMPGNDKSSIRTFPPTNLTFQVIRPSFIYPMGNFPLKMVLSGVMDNCNNSQSCWHLKKIVWRIEEHQKIVSEACQKHVQKDSSEGNGILYQKTRIIAKNEEKNGWKTDFDTAGGEISMQWEASINPATNPLCDTEGHDSLEVKHNLIIELIMAEKFGLKRKTQLVPKIDPTRVLRMRFKLRITERSGLGISWDEEMPPVYEDVPIRPPVYSKRDHTDKSPLMLQSTRSWSAWSHYV